MNLKLRITGGSHRGRKLLSPPRATIRPASDMIRQAVFNMLGDLVEDAIFYDVFAGTGIVGLEALSRGARRAIFIENDRNSVQLIRQNVQRAGFNQDATVRLSDAHVWAGHFVAELDPTVVFLGPPYPLFDDQRPAIWEMVGRLHERLGDDDALVLQFPRFVRVDELPDFDNWYRLRHYGKTQVGIWLGKGIRARLARPAPEDDLESGSSGSTESADPTAAPDDDDAACATDGGQ